MRLSSSYKKTINPRNWVRNWKHNEKHKMVQARVISETTMTVFPSKTFYRTPCERTRETTIEAQQQQEKLEPFNPTVQEQDQHTQKSVA
jgi:hypothetical protein